MKDYFYEKINYLLNKLNIKIDYEIKKTDDEYNFLFVQKKYDKYYFNVNDKKIDIDLIDIFLLHEIFHIIQFEEKFPMLILSDNTMKYSIIQKIITDLYNTEKMIEANYLNEAFTLHQYRLNNLKLKNLKMNKIDLIQFEDAYRIVLNHVLYHNTHILTTYTKSADMKMKGIITSPMELWKYGTQTLMPATTFVSRDDALYHMLLPCQDAKLSRFGIERKGLPFFNPSDKDLHIYLINYDKDKIDNNTFKVINQIEYVENHLRIPDGVIYINGIPLVIFEFKSAIKENTTIHDAYDQLTIRYKRDIPSIFKYNAFGLSAYFLPENTSKITSLSSTLLNI